MLLCQRCLPGFVQDPVDAAPAVLVKRYNITQHKELEHKLSIREEDLLRFAQYLPSCLPDASRMVLLAVQRANFYAK